MSESQSKQAAVVVAGLTKRYGKQTAVDDLSLSIPAGTTLGFLGPNGAGKTTTIKVLMGLLVRDAGRAAILGLDPVIDPVGVRGRVGYVPEESFVHRWMRVGEVIRFCRSFYRTWNDRLCDELLTLFGLDAGKKVRQLSKGMAVKLSLLLAVAHEPEVLLLDEPMAGLDPVAREEVLEGVLRTIGDRPRTLLFSSHTLGDVQRMADTIAILHEGRLLVHRPVDDLLRTTKRIRGVLSDGSTAPDPPAGTVWQRVNGREWLMTVRDFSAETVERLRAGSALQHVEVVDLSLEEIFKDLVRGWRG